MWDYGQKYEYVFEQRLGPIKAKCAPISWINAVRYYYESRKNNFHECKCILNKKKCGFPDRIQILVWMLSLWKSFSWICTPTTSYTCGIFMTTCNSLWKKSLQGSLHCYKFVAEFVKKKFAYSMQYKIRS